MLIIGLALALALVAVSPASADAAPGNTSAPPRIASSASGPDEAWSEGSWCWFGDPRAVRVGGPRHATFVGWIDAAGGITIGEYDDRLGIVRTVVIGRLFHDDHGSPSILVEPHKRITVFWSAHNGSTMNFRTTRRPEDITAWGPVEHLPVAARGSEGFTYPNPVELPAEHHRLYLFWRGANWSQDYATRTLSGAWSPARQVIEVPGARPYVKVDSDGSDTIGLAFTDGHPRERVTSVYYAAYRDGSLWSASGRWIGRLGHGPIAPKQADLVYNGPKDHVSAWVWDVAFDSEHQPVIVYATFPSAANHAYWYARWNGRRWESHLMTRAGPSISPKTIEQQYSGGITLDHGNPSIVYLSRKVGGWFEIERWTTADGGHIWSHRTVVRTPGSNDVRPVVPRGSQGGPMGLLWLRGNYNSYTGYRTSISFIR